MTRQVDTVSFDRISEAFDEVSKMAEVFGNTLIDIMGKTDVDCDEAPMMARKVLERFGIAQTPSFKKLTDYIDGKDW